MEWAAPGPQVGLYDTELWFLIHNKKIFIVPKRPTHRCITGSWLMRPHQHPTHLRSDRARKVARPTDPKLQDLYNMIAAGCPEKDLVGSSIKHVLETRYLK